MTVWEYKIVNSTEAEGGGLLSSPSKENLEAYLNALGAEGWEIIDLGVQDFDTMAFVGLARRPRRAGRLRD